MKSNNQVQLPASGTIVLRHLTVQLFLQLGAAAKELSRIRLRIGKLFQDNRRQVFGAPFFLKEGTINFSLRVAGISRQLAVFVCIACLLSVHALAQTNGGSAGATGGSNPQQQPNGNTGTGGAAPSGAGANSALAQALADSAAANANLAAVRTSNAAYQATYNGTYANLTASGVPESQAMVTALATAYGAAANAAYTTYAASIGTPGVGQAAYGAAKAAYTGIYNTVYSTLTASGASKSGAEAAARSAANQAAAAAALKAANGDTTLATYASYAAVLNQTYVAANANLAANGGTLNAINIAREEAGKANDHVAAMAATNQQHVQGTSGTGTSGAGTNDAKPTSGAAPSGTAAEPNAPNTHSSIIITPTQTSTGVVMSSSVKGDVKRNASTATASHK
jgi:hypothetical protein